MTCSSLNKLQFGRIEPRSCLSRKIAYGTKCTFRCDHGYKLIGPYSKQCTENAKWNPSGSAENKCLGGYRFIDDCWPMIV